MHLTSLPANYDLYLYNADGQLLASSTRPGHQAEHITLRDRPPGLYYVLVVGVDGAHDPDNTYQLRFGVH